MKYAKQLLIDQLNNSPATHVAVRLLKFPKDPEDAPYFVEVYLHNVSITLEGDLILDISE